MITAAQVEANLTAFTNNLFANTKYVFADYVHTYRFLGADAAGINLEIENEWTVVNLLDEPIEHGTGIDIEEDDQPKFSHLSYTNSDGVVFTSDGSDLIKPSGRPRVVRAVGPKVTIPARDSLRIKWAYSQRGNRADNDVMSMGTVTSGVTVKAMYNPGVFDVSLYSLNPHTESADSGTRVWTFAPEQVFLTEQHAQIVWSVK